MGSTVWGRLIVLLGSFGRRFCLLAQKVAFCYFPAFSGQPNSVHFERRNWCVLVLVCFHSIRLCGIGILEMEMVCVNAHCSCSTLIWFFYLWITLHLYGSGFGVEFKFDMLGKFSAACLSWWRFVFDLNSILEYIIYVWIWSDVQPPISNTSLLFCRILDNHVGFWLDG